MFPSYPLANHANSILFLPVLQSAVMQPFLDAKLTQGMVDGGDRGSNKALGPLLDELLSYVKEVSRMRFYSA